MVDVLLSVVDWFSQLSTDILNIGGLGSSVIGSSEIGDALSGTEIDYNNMSS